MKRLILFLLLLVGCAVGVMDPPEKIKNPDCGVPHDPDAGLQLPWITCDSYYIQLDYEFENYQTEQIISAWNTWKDVLGDTISYKVVENCSMEVDESPCQIKVIKQDPPPGYAGYCYWHSYPNKRTYSALITIKEDLKGDYLYRVALVNFGTRPIRWGVTPPIRRFLNDIQCFRKRQNQSVDSR
jgi:hypothetical protein